LSLFRARLLTEGIRVIEGESPIQSTYSSKSKSATFEQLLFERTNIHKQSSEINSLFSHFDRLLKNFYRLFALLLFIFGGLAVQNMLFTEQLASINFFWAFILFFIPNLLMLLLWSIFFLKQNVAEDSGLYRFSLGVMKLLENRFNKASSTKKDHSSLLHCYFNVHFGKQLGRYQLSKLTHLLWLSYFSGAMLMSVVMLATHQVNFVWQTSILSSDTFETLTQVLAYLPMQLGFPVPTTEQIQQSYLNAHQLLDAENRRLAWSSLLISSLLLYGVLPRLLLFLLMSYQFKQKTKTYELDYSHPYYVQLRQQLKPNKTNLGVMDEDTETKEVSNNAFLADNQPAKSALPSHYYPVAIELSAKQFALAENHRLRSQSIHNVVLENICDHQGQQATLMKLQHSEKKTLVIYVALNRLPDRGLKRFINQLVSLSGKDLYLAIVVENNHNKQRDNDWYQLANQVGINLDNISHVEAKEVIHE